MEKQHTWQTHPPGKRDISPLPIKEERNNETVSSGILNMYDHSKEQYPDAMALIRVGDEYKAYNQEYRKDSMRYLAYAQGKRCRKRRRAGHDSLVPSRRSGYASP